MNGEEKRVNGEEKRMNGKEKRVNGEEGKEGTCDCKVGVMVSVRTFEKVLEIFLRKFWQTSIHSPWV